MSELNPRSHEWQPNRFGRMVRHIARVWYQGYANYLPNSSSEMISEAAVESEPTIEPNVDFHESTLHETRQDRRDCKRLQKIQTADELVFLFERLPRGPFEAL